jgi:hypothetical protein
LNYGAVRYCVHCRKIKSAAEFRPLPGLRARREVCAECFSKVMSARQQIREARMKKDSVPF